MAEVAAGAEATKAVAGSNVIAGAKAIGAKGLEAGAGVGAAVAGLAKTGFSYNRAAYQYDQTLRWQRFTTGRKFAQEQTEMFRQDVEDLTQVAKNKLKTYGPIMTMSIGYCVTVLVEGRSGLKFPAPPTFLSGLYLQCLGVAFAYFTLAVWLVFHAALRAQVACVQLRTRKVRLPVPTQSQLDNARRLSSTFEEQDYYDIFKLPYVMPQNGELDDWQHDEDDYGTAEQAQGKKHAKGGKSSSSSSKAGSTKEERFAANHFPGFSGGVPTWIEKEYEERDELPGAAPGGTQIDGPPWQHFELVRQVQKEWWSAEAYNRICMLYGMMHFLQAFAYWFVVHCMTDLALFWTGVAGSTSIVAAVWLIFRMDVLPDKGGCFPIEFAGPFVASIATGLSYTHSPTQLTQDTSRTIAGICFVMHIVQAMRMYVLAKPSSSATGGVARESGGRIFNQSASCEAPSWLPQSFQVVTYLIAPPQDEKQMKKELAANDALAAGEKADAEYEVDMRPWYYTRATTLIVILGWSVLLAGQIVESVMGERMLMTNSGTPPWTRRPLWYGWEFGPITSKHYAHVTPQRGHYSWQVGWGPQGQQELWPSDLFGFHPEADMWWAEAEAPPGMEGSGAWGHGENHWLEERIKYGAKGELHLGSPHPPDHSTHVHSAMPEIATLDSAAENAHGGAASAGHSVPAHRRLRGDEVETARVLVPAAVQWPALLEPELLVCGSQGEHGSIAALTRNGFGAIVPEAAAAGRSSGAAVTFSLKGLPKIGMALGMTWSDGGLMVVTDSGEIARCPAPVNASHGSCWPLSVPKLPVGELPAAVVDAADGTPLRAAVVSSSGKIALLELSSPDGMEQVWEEIGQVQLPLGTTDDASQPQVVAVVASPRRLFIASGDGVVHHWKLHDGRPASAVQRDVPSVGVNRVWRSACALPDGQILRLASTWRKAAGDDLVFHPELLI